jgi:hypothetical protein
MWRSVVQQDIPRRGDRFRKDLFIGNGYTLWTEYEVIETSEIEIILKPLVSNGRTLIDDPAQYKRMRYPVLYQGGTRIWIGEQEKSGGREVRKSESRKVVKPLRYHR